MGFTDRIMSLMPGVRAMRSAVELTGDIRVAPPRAAAGSRVSDGDTLRISDVFRALQILTTSAAQVSIKVERQGSIVADTPALIRKPNLDMSRSVWVTQLVMSLAFTGNGYILKERGPGGEVINLVLLNPRAVHIEQDSRTGRITYHHDGAAYTRRDVEHLMFMPPLPGQLYGLGPIQAAQHGMVTRRDMADHMSRWFHDTGQPRGILSSKQKLNAEQARAHRNAWNGLDADGNPVPTTANPSGIKVLDMDTSYQSILLSPRDALWLEAQSWTTRDLAKLFGIPASLMLVALEGNSQSYANVEQDWLGFTRFSLMGYLRPIEEALTEISPNGQTVRFNVESLLRTDTKTRYQSHQIGLDAGFLTVNEVRALENLPRIESEEFDIPHRNTPTTTTQETNTNA